ncbi:methylthioadenosine phosphorylase [Microbulbifer thermotolerans]|uniref:S-methyl-5'-thioadenosine phosphorylase n=1 Tax=Microbulbifer thermotolerans TaxID=252514 RepID=UPI0008EED90F|nr:S-methyl-5'-thioadenosine phosphorylase [Microbulbifer thermotolerans]MCX2793833.1 S-methyl-5'-thioadenosine phosphorylase [Microbulbifer thermotolerans]MCX2834333.1 S-methyl-5'-thioadenosine phosphorylase [Microbulbifer thermotolerans]WKT61653.1 S-methyl-5'-thioadenosine phosphorylase [Microbulbifer thermotolerans]SFB71372.1 methylthioadenosine phosphorylase [Microbulbifer thermotolerans]
MAKALIGVIGGSGLYDMQGLTGARELQIETPFGPTSDAIVAGRLHGIPVAFLARHGRGHRLIPSEVPYRANIHALRQLGVRYILSLSAVGSLREEVRPLDMLIPDQFIDLTRRRESTFFGQGAVAHVSMADPVCPQVADCLARAFHATQSDQPIRLHRGGTYVCIEGPQFSTRAESHWYRAMGASVIGMTNMPEAKLAREAQIAYATLAMATDYDCWHEREAAVTAEVAIANLQQNAARAQRIAAEAIRLLGEDLPESAAHSALASGLVTPVEALSAEAAAVIKPLLATTGIAEEA